MTVEQITQMIIQYAPVVASFVLVVFNIAKTLKGFKVIDINPPINNLRSELSKTYDKFTSEIQALKKENIDIKAVAAKAENRCVDLESKLNASQAKIIKLIETQNEKLTTIVENDVKCKAEVRRKK